MEQTIDKKSEIDFFTENFTTQYNSLIYCWQVDFLSKEK